MQPARRDLFETFADAITVTHTVAGSPRRAETEAFIRASFARHYGAEVSAFAPHLMLLEQQQRIVAATGWRAAKDDALFLERYLDQPVEQALARLAKQEVRRERIVEVGNLAAEKPGGTVQVVRALTAHLDRLGYEWVVFTATRELVGIFSRLGLPLLAIAAADPARLGDAVGAWGRYYETQPVVVAGRIRRASERIGRTS
ncbi:MAG: thermostable hemolysin [Betaproteobacteria bacterium]|nr:thermostable hemolysin [Betaproteobacteria bacterium]MBK7081279.1 thermostable hemolysin [Betaproteobacteria bacterium]MBK7589852.1 thermostable hemolysin [Betaproteobacteria bacterium]MBK7744668.1 thermostable hemolysin [Betaproteobacteria bacterium]MBK8687019.1 thermostable hemolysin [Betaproteobacteria bacterium]